MIDAVLVKNANRMMTVASLLEDGIELSFADGAKGLIPYSDLPEIGELATLSTLELPNPYEMVLKTAQGATVEIPWDFARHYCDACYRPAAEAVAMRGRHTLGQRVRRLRNAAGLSQVAVAGAAGEGGAHAEVQDPECSCQGAGGGRLEVVGGAGGSAAIVVARGPRGVPRSAARCRTMWTVRRWLRRTGAARKEYALKWGMYWVLRCGLWCMMVMWRRRMLRGCGGGWWGEIGVGMSLGPQTGP